MAATETLKTKAQLLTDLTTLIPDNHDEAIEPEHVRDFLLDVVHSAFGCEFMLSTGASALSISSATTAAPGDTITGFNAGASGASDVMISTANGTATIPAGGDGTYLLGFTASVAPTASTAVIEFQVCKNGSAIAGLYATQVGQDSTTAIQLLTVSLTGAGRVALAADDVLTLRQRNTTGARTLNSSVQFFGRRVAA